MTEYHYNNATHELATKGEPIRCFVLGKRGESLHLRLCPKNLTGTIDVFATPNRVSELPSGVEDLL